MHWIAGWTVLLAASAAAQESRAVAYLAGEVRDWSRENGCFSCHNNGDGARALYMAARMGFSVPDDALEETARWLRSPERWDKAEASEAFHDLLLARIQFSAAVVESDSKEGLAGAAEVLVGDQQEDGTWRIDAGSSIGSPATYGTALATYLARRTLSAADPVRFAHAIARADAWFRGARPASVLDCAAVVLATTSGGCLDMLRKAQNADGGWGAWARSPSEPFDTAVALLALRHSGGSDGAIERGRAFLLRTQQTSGGWTETTRPGGGRSYAQHISTTAWATIALLQTKRD